MTCDERGHIRLVDVVESFGQRYVEAELPGDTFVLYHEIGRGPHAGLAQGPRVPTGSVRCDKCGDESDSEPGLPCGRWWMCTQSTCDGLYRKTWLCPKCGHPARYITEAFVEVGQYDEQRKVYEAEGDVEEHVCPECNTEFYL